MRKAICCLAYSAICVMTSTAWSNTIQVPGDYPSIQSAIDVAVNGDEVVVAPGVYYERNINFFGKAITVRSTDPQDLAVVKATVVDAIGIGQGCGFVFSSNENNRSVLSGLSIIHGNTEPPSQAGGILCSGASPSISYCVITQNHDRGIACEDGASPSVSFCTITENVGDYFGDRSGGGVACENNSMPTFSYCTIADNETFFDGGGIHCHSGSVVSLTHCTISRNRAIEGGGIYCGAAALQIKNSEISDNQVIEYLYPAYGGGISSFTSTITLQHSIIARNRNDFADSALGGGMYIYGGTPSITNCIFVENGAKGGGGLGVEYVKYTSGTITNCTLVNNHSITSGLAGGIWISDSPGLAITNSILWGNTSNGVPDQTSISFGVPPMVNYCDIQQETWPGTGNIDINPRFMSFLGFDYLLRKGSPCIDAGDPALLDGYNWPPKYNNGVRSDMGAYGGPNNAGWLD